MGDCFFRNQLSLVGGCVVQEYIAGEEGGDRFDGGAPQCYGAYLVVQFVTFSLHAGPIFTTQTHYTIQLRFCEPAQYRCVRPHSERGRGLTQCQIDGVMFYMFVVG